MSEKTKTETEVKTVSQKPAERYNKERILASGAYKKNRDLLNVLLENDKSYTKQEINKLIEGYLKREVK